MQFKCNIKSRELTLKAGETEDTFRVHQQYDLTDLADVDIYDIDMCDKDTPLLEVAYLLHRLTGNLPLNTLKYFADVWVMSLKDTEQKLGELVTLLGKTPDILSYNKTRKIDMLEPDIYNIIWECLNLSEEDSECGLNDGLTELNLPSDTHHFLENQIPLIIREINTQDLSTPNGEDIVLRLYEHHFKLLRVLITHFEI